MFFEERPTREGLASMLEHSVLAPSAGKKDIVEGCALARRLGAGVMMVQPFWLGLVVSELAGSDVIPASVLAFPHGASLPSAKAYEAERLAQAGAREIDMVMNVSAVKSGDCDAAERDIAGVVAAAAGHGAKVKVILETSLLTDEEIVASCRISERAGAAFVKTSTGFASGGATTEHVALMRRSVDASVGVKASGGIRTLAAALAMIRYGASRIGTSSTEKILSEL